MAKSGLVLFGVAHNRARAQSTSGGLLSSSKTCILLTTGEVPSAVPLCIAVLSCGTEQCKALCFQLLFLKILSPPPSLRYARPRRRAPYAPLFISLPRALSLFQRGRFFVSYVKVTNELSQGDSGSVVYAAKTG